MGEKWFQFVTRIKNETNAPSLKAAMKIASKRKSEWNKDGKVAPMNKTGKVAPMNKTGKGRGSRRNRGTRKNR
jgi:hypothetical protein